MAEKILFVMLLFGFIVITTMGIIEKRAAYQRGLAECDSLHKSSMVAVKKASALYQQKYLPSWDNPNYGDTTYGNADSVLIVEQQNLDWLYQLSQWGIANGITFRGDSVVTTRGITIVRDCDSAGDGATIHVYGCPSKGEAIRGYERIGGR